MPAMLLSSGSMLPIQRVPHTSQPYDDNFCSEVYSLNHFIDVPIGRYDSCHWDFDIMLHLPGIASTNFAVKAEESRLGFACFEWLE